MQLLDQIESSGTTAQESAGNVDNSESTKEISTRHFGITHP